MTRARRFAHLISPYMHKLLWTDMYMLWYMIVMLYLVYWYVYDMICWRHAWDMLCDYYDIWYVHDENFYVWKHENVMISH